MGSAWHKPRVKRDREEDLERSFPHLWGRAWVEVTKYSGKFCGWMVLRTVIKCVEPTQERVFGLWMHRLKRTEALERGQKDTEREGKQMTNRAPIKPTTQVNQRPIRGWQNRVWIEYSNEEGRNLFRTKAELEERHNNGKSQEEKSDAAGNFSREHRQWVVRNEKSEMSNRSGERSKQ